MFAKLFAVALIAVAFVAVSEAAVAVITYGDSNCNTAVGYYASNQACDPLTKRSTEEIAGITAPVCTAVSADGPWYQVPECTNSVGDPNTAIPSGFQSLKISSTEGCNFTDYEVVGTLSGLNPVVLYSTVQVIPTNVNVSCINGVMSFETCVPKSGCNTFSSVLPNVCTNATSTIMGAFFNGIQTSCGATPQAPMTAPMAAAPVAAPKAATPARKSDAVSVAVGSVVALAAAATLLW